MQLIYQNPAVYFYHGSDMTESNKEDVLWVIFKQMRSIGKDQYKFIKEQFKDNKDQKPIQDTQNEKDNPVYFNPFGISSFKVSSGNK